jgi:hypothetical protein
MSPSNFREVTRYECVKCGRMYDVRIPSCRCSVELFSTQPQQAYVRYARALNAKAWKQIREVMQELVGYSACLRNRIDDVLLGMGPDADKSLSYLQEHLKVLENKMAICKVLLGKKK